MFYFILPSSCPLTEPDISPQKLESFLKEATAALDELKRVWLRLLPGENTSAGQIRETITSSAAPYRAALDTADGVLHAGEECVRLGGGGIGVWLKLCRWRSDGDVCLQCIHNLVGTKLMTA